MLPLFCFGWLRSDTSAEILNAHFSFFRPDRKTTYMTDDGTDVMFNKFVATRENDLSTGELFCAKFIQTSPKEGAASGFDSTVKWISMGTASNADFEAKIKTTKFQDMFDVADVKNGTCSEGQYLVDSCAADFCVQTSVWRFDLKTA